MCVVIVVLLSLLLVPPLLLLLLRVLLLLLLLLVWWVWSLCSGFGRRCCSLGLLRLVVVAVFVVLLS